MVIVKANKDSEAGVLPTKQEFAEMGKFNQELIKAGIILAADGLQPSSKGTRIRFSGDERAVIDGPFAETKELVGGYWIWKLNSKAEAIGWLKRAPFRNGEEVEIRQIYEMEDFGDALPREVAAQERAMKR
jgi:hypothetical protein